MNSCDFAQIFLAQPVLAVVGASRKKSDFSRQLLNLMRHHGGQVFAVNSQTDELDGEPCFRTVADLPAPVDGALLMVSDAAVDEAIRECLAAGVPRIWVYGVGHPKKLGLETLTLCQEKKVTVINGLCPRMFLKDTAWPHRFHKWIALKNRAYRLSPA